MTLEASTHFFLGTMFVPILQANLVTTSHTAYLPMMMSNSQHFVASSAQWTRASSTLARKSSYCQPTCVRFLFFLLLLPVESREFPDILLYPTRRASSRICRRLSEILATALISSWQVSRALCTPLKTFLGSLTTIVYAEGKTG